MNSKAALIVIGVAILAVLAVGYFVMNGGRKIPGKFGTPTVTVTPGANTIFMDNFAFQPRTLTVPVGTTVTWVNKESSIHDVRSSLFTSPSLRLNESFSFTFNQAGTYDFSCGIHPTMTGKIIVQ